MRTLIFTTLFFLTLPSAVLAHATPVEITPASGTQLTESPEEIIIRFSERLERGSSRIKVFNTLDEEVTASVAEVASDDRYVLSAPLKELHDSVYTVAWSVVSQDDGHFTKGSFAFSVGAAVVSASAADSTVIQITSYPEATAMFVEFTGNSLLWGILLMFALVLRPLLKNDTYKGHSTLIRRIYTALVYIGAVLGITGALAQIAWKTRELAELHGETISEALHMYTHTTAGNSALWRIGAFLLVGIIFAFTRKQIFRAERFSWSEGLLITALTLFAYFRAIVSHATANPFHPELSTVINMLHLVEKDVWPGVLIVLLVLFFTQARFSLLPAALSHTFAFLSVNLILISLSASYIIWLHLKDLSNISSTLWGENFLMLLAAAVLLVVVRVYHVLIFRFKPQLVQRYFGFSISFEIGAAFLVIFFTSLVIITSPPLHGADTKVFLVRDDGASIRLERSAYEDVQALLTIKGGREEPIVLIGGEGGLLAPLSKRFDGGYVFPLALIENKDTQVHISARRESGYDMRAIFDVKREDLTIPKGHGRTLDFFTWIMLGVALAGAIFGTVLHALLKRTQVPMSPPRFSVAGVPLGFALGIFSVLVVAAFLQYFLGNDFKRQCEADGNMWHMMLPQKAGIPTSQTPQEGCMWGMGAYLYHFADEREYRYVSALGESEVVFEHGRLVAGVPATFDIAVKDAEGKPAQLLVDMEKLIHVVIVSKDQEVFAHVHPDDTRPLTQDEITNSRFSVSHTFPKSGEYIVAVDYAHGITLKSQQFVVNVEGAAAQKPEPRIYASPANFGGYNVALEYSQPFAGEVSTFRYKITKDGKPIELYPYLSAAMHIAIVKNDFSSFLHTHGEVHPPGAPIPPVIVKNGKTVHSMASMTVPPQFSLPVDAHVIFPEPGVYTMWGQFKAGDEVVPTAFTVRVE